MAGDANDFDPTHPLSKYQDRIPKRYLEQGWRVVDIESAFGGNLFRAYLRRPWHDELIVSDDWCSNIDHRPGRRECDRAVDGGARPVAELVTT
jgi:hypothetical protein